MAAGKSLESWIVGVLQVSRRAAVQPSIRSVARRVASRGVMCFIAREVIWQKEGLCKKRDKTACVKETFWSAIKF